MGRFFVCLASLTFLAGGLRQANADSVLLLSTGIPTEDNAVVNLLTADGHTVTVGPDYFTFTGGSLSGYSSVILLQNNNVTGLPIPDAGQTALVNYVNGGGGLLTGEWTVYGNAFLGYNPTLAPVLPVTPSTVQSFGNLITYTQSTATNSVLNKDLPPSFTFIADSNGGTETYFQPKSGATAYYGSNFGGTPPGDSDGVIGWNYGSGRVLSLSTLAGQNELADPNYGTLFSNAVYFVAVPEPSTLILLSIGALGLTLHHCWRRRKQAA